MIARCPKCQHEYNVDSNGKYQCGICEKKFFVYPDGFIEDADGIAVASTSPVNDDGSLDIGTFLKSSPIPPPAAITPEPEAVPEPEAAPEVVPEVALKLKLNMPVPPTPPAPTVQGNASAPELQLTLDIPQTAPQTAPEVQLPPPEVQAQPPQQAFQAQPPQQAFQAQPPVPTPVMPPPVPGVPFTPNAKTNGKSSRTIVLIMLLVVFLTAAITATTVLVITRSKNKFNTTLLDKKFVRKLQKIFK